MDLLVQDQSNWRLFPVLLITTWSILRNILLQWKHLIQNRLQTTFMAETPTRSKHYIHDAKVLAKVTKNTYAFRRTFEYYRCEAMVATMTSGYKLECSPSTTSYAGLACIAESHSFLKVRDPFFFPTGPDLVGVRVRVGRILISFRDKITTIVHYVMTSLDLIS